MALTIHSLNGATREKYYIFKRKFDAARSQTEAEELKKLTEKNFNAKPPEPDFVDLDRAETQIKIAQTNSQIEKKLEEKLRSINTFSLTEIKATQILPINSKISGLI